MTMLDNVDWNRVRDDETVPIINLVSKINLAKEELRREMRRTQHHLFVIADSIDFGMYATFQNHERRES